MQLEVQDEFTKGTIGTGLFLLSGEMITSGGPLGALFAYVIAGLSVYCVVMSLGEMATLIPISGSFSSYSQRFLGPVFGFTTGWTYWFGWVVTLPLELIACAQFLSYWIPNVNSWVIMLSVLGISFFCLPLAFLTVLNLASVKGYGEAEYWMSMMKVLAIVVFIFTTIVVLFRDHLGFSNYNSGGTGPFNQGGVWGVASNMVSAAFAFGGTELVGITAGEAKNPTKSVPRAINGTFWRLAIFYMSSIFMIGLVVPSGLLKSLSGSENALARSPFVIAFELAKIPGAAGIMNGVALISVFSAANSSIYASSRTLMGLAQSGQAPRLLGKANSWGVPVASVLVSCAIGLCSLTTTLFGDGVVFKWLVNLTGLVVLVTWIFISISHIQFRKALKAQHFPVAKLPYKSPLGLVADYISLFINLTVLIFSGVIGVLQGEPYSIRDFLSNYAGLFLYPTLFLLFFAIHGTMTFVDPAEADIQTGRYLGTDEEEKDTGRLNRIFAILA